MVTGREVLQGAAVAAASSAIGSGAEFAAEPGWFDKPMRWAQLNSTEDDAAEMDIPFWLDYFQRIHADALCITAGGVVAFYPTKIKYHRASQWLERRPDYLRQVVEGCRKLGMAVVARTDPHATYEDVYRDHPDWIAVDAEGRKRRHWEMPDMWVTCALGPYNFEFMTEVTKEIGSTFPEVGGVFSNRWEGSGMGRVVYFPWDIDRVYWEVMVDDHGRLLRNAIDWALDEERPVTVSGAGVLDVTVWKQKNSMTVHMVNLTNSMMMRPSFREMIPSPPQQVRLRLPEGRRVSKVQFLVAGTAPGVRIAGGLMTVDVPSIRDHEVIAIDFA